MNAKLSNLSCEEFLKKLASKEPTPGGGGAAAMCGAMAAALSSMVANLTIGKKGLEANEEQVKRLLLEAEHMRGSFLELIEADAQVFDTFMSCYALPKSTEEEKKARLDAIHAAAKQAADVPMQVVRISVRLLKIAKEMAELGNPNLITDAGCSAVLARAALDCSEYNVLINVPLTKDAVYNEAVLAELSSLKQTAYELAAEVDRLTRAKL